MSKAAICNAGISYRCWLVLWQLYFLIQFPDNGLGKQLEWLKFSGHRAHVGDPDETPSPVLVNAAIGNEPADEKYKQTKKPPKTRWVYFALFKLSTWNFSPLYFWKNLILHEAFPDSFTFLCTIIKCLIHLSFSFDVHIFVLLISAVSDHFKGKKHVKILFLLNKI